jgi:putative PIN family toxin of toxin-antitoxin system
MRLVLDTDVLVAALRSSTGASSELLRLAGHARCTLIVSVPLMLEYEAVLLRPEHLHAGGIGADAALAFLDGIANLAEHTEVHFQYRPATRDPEDELVLEAAVNGRAQAIVTFNRRDYGAGPSRFVIRCWLPYEALEQVR